MPNEPKTAYPGVSFPAYYDLNGDPAVVVAGRMLPQVLKSGQWEVHYDPPAFWRDAERITKEELDKLVAAEMKGQPAPEPRTA